MNPRTFQIMRIYLLGFMGSGKTTWGISLAARLGMPFVDLDALIQSREGASVQQIFAEVGESGFRMIEQAHLHTIKRYRKAVVATGGGAPCFFDNMDWMIRSGLTVYLKTAPELLHQRLKAQTTGRPLLKRFSEDELLPFIRETVREREAFYGKAELILNQTGNDRSFLIELEEKIRAIPRRIPLRKQRIISENTPEKDT